MGPENLFDEFFTFSSNSDELLETFPERLLSVCYEQYIRDFGRFAEKTNLRVPWYVPKEYGGVGLRSFGRHRPSPLDRATCALMADGFDRPVSVKKETVWKFHSAVQASLENDLHYEEDGGCAYDKWYGLAVKFAFQRCINQENFDMVYCDHDKSRVQGSLRKNEKIWRKYTKMAKSCDRFNHCYQFIPGTNLKPVFLETEESQCLF